MNVFIETAYSCLLAAMVGVGGVHSDASILRQTYEAFDPGLYRYNTAAQMDDHFSQLDAALARDRDVRSAYLDISRFTSAIKCGHCYPNFFNQPPAIAAELFQGHDRVPFYFVWIDRRMIITRNFSTDVHLSPGTEVESINGLPVGNILAALMPLVRADGSNDAKRIDELSVQGDDRYEAFDVYFPLVYPQHSTTMHLHLKVADGSEHDAEVEALTYQQRIAPIQASLSAQHGGSSPLWSLQFIDDRTAYLKMPTWDVYDSKWDWKKFLNDAFARLDRVKPERLIIDLRGNEGGSDVGSVLLSHFVQSQLNLDAYVRLVRFRSVTPELRPYLSTWDSSFYDLGKSAAVYDAQRFELMPNDGEDATLIQPIVPRYGGQIYVLVDASNSSATFNFDSVVQQHHLGSLVGTPTGGNRRGIDGGAFFFVTLPNSHIEVDVPLIGTFPTQPQPDAGLLPDVPVKRTAADIAAGNDPDLAVVLSRP
jgi:C-terminal processing protease CtpA/Prc